MWRLIYFIPVWILVSPLKLAVVFLGVITVPLATIFKAYKITEERPEGHPKFADGHKYNWSWKWMKHWDNHTDGIACYGERNVGPLWLQILYWSIWRNPANGLRLMEPYSVIINPSKIKFVGSDRPVESFKDKTPHWFLCWHGIYSCFFLNIYIYPGHMRRLWIGWKLLPQDSFGVPEDDYRSKGSAFTFQFKRISK